MIIIRTEEVGRFQGKGGNRSTACSVSTGSDREIGSRRTGLVSSAAGRNGGFLLLVGAPEEELLPALSVAAAAAAEPEPREKPTGTVEGVAKA